MQTATLQFMSRALGRHVQYTALIPDLQRHGPGPFPVLYQLHGRSDDHTAWTVRSRLPDHVAAYGLIVVLPDGGISGWRNCGPHERYEDFVIDDLYAHVTATLPVRPGRAAIGGLSMGGGGAVRLGLKHPERFASIWAHSSSLANADVLMRGGATPEQADADDVFAIAMRLVGGMPRPSLPRLAFDCGTEDGLRGQNVAFHQHLDAIGYPHIYREHPGGHTWEYWDTHVREALAQHAPILAVTRR